MFVDQPYDGTHIDEIASDDLSAVEARLATASLVFQDRAGWLPAHERIGILKRLAVLVELEQEQFTVLIAREGGKPLTDARAEVSRAITGIELAASEIGHLAGEEIPMGLTPASQGRWAFTTREPIGVVVAISAFNHPLNLIVHQVIPAIATGCPVIVKPSAVTPLSCLRLVQLCYEAGLPEVWCQTVITDDNALAQALATDARVAFLTFIGSAKVGWHLRSLLAPGTRCSLEHGGAAPVIIDRSADIDRILEPLAKGGYYHAGQVCVSSQRLFVHADIVDAFTERFSERVSRLRVGDPTLADTEVGPLILPREVDRVESWVHDAVEQSASVTTGGTRIGERSYQPTVLFEPSANALVSRQEVFGPVTSIYRYTQVEQAISRANSLPFAFQAAVFTSELDIAIKAARLLDASAVMINDHTAFRTDWMPFAGRRQSGYGIGGIPYTMHDMTASKMIAIKF